MNPPSQTPQGQAAADVPWKGCALVLPTNGTALMEKTPNGSMIFAFVNKTETNSAGDLLLTSGAGDPENFVSPARILDPRVLIRNWKGNSLKVTNDSAADDTPIMIEAYGPGIGPKPAELPIGPPGVSVKIGATLQAVTGPNAMQLQLKAQQLALFGIIGGPVDASGNNAYAIAVHSRAGNTGPPTQNKPPPGYYATTDGDRYVFKFNWEERACLFVAYFGSGHIVPKITAAVTDQPTAEVMLL